MQAGSKDQEFMNKCRCLWTKNSLCCNWHEKLFFFFKSSDMKNISNYWQKYTLYVRTMKKCQSATIFRNRQLFNRVRWKNWDTVFNTLKICVRRNDASWSTALLIVFELQSSLKQGHANGTPSAEWHTYEKYRNSFASFFLNSNVVWGT